MPELPEVQTVVSGLAKVLIGKIISDVETFWDRTIATPDPEEFRKNLIGNTIQNISRRSKFIVITFENKSIWLTHLRMSGKFRFRKTETKSEEISSLRVKIAFTDGTFLLFNDFRKFAKMYWFPDLRAAELAEFSKLGPDALDVNAEDFFRIFHSKKGKIKANLLRQDLISGMGNIYADESLFAAGIHPESETSRIPEKKLRELHTVIQDILRRAIVLKGTSMRNYADINGRAGSFSNFLQVYRKTGKKCPNCGGLITRIRVVGRGTHICEVCQEKY